MIANFNKWESTFSHLAFYLLLATMLLSQCKQTQLSSESLRFLIMHWLHPHQWSGQSAASLAFIAITTGRLENVVPRVPLWSSGLVTLPGHSSMYCKSVQLAPNWLLIHLDGFYFKTQYVSVKWSVHSLHLTAHTNKITVKASAIFQPFDLSFVFYCYTMKVLFFTFFFCVMTFFLKL